MPKRRRSSRKSYALTPRETRAAITSGKKAAKDAFKGRRGDWRAFQRASKELAEKSVSEPEQRIKPEIMKVLSGPSAGTLVAQGDSWFDYPSFDILKLLHSKHAYTIESVANRGERVENMAFDPRRRTDFLIMLEKVLARGEIPKAILLSGGGNDIAGEEFGMLLNHANSPLTTWNDDVVSGVIGKRIPTAYLSLISLLRATCREYMTGPPIPILLHGYAHPVPDGRGYAWGGWHWGLPGPWLKPGFDEKALTDITANTDHIRALIDAFNTMIQGVAKQFPAVHYIDLRPFLTDGKGYRTDWENKLHPTKSGFGLLAAEYARVLDNL